MFPKYTIDNDFIKKHWKDPKDVKSITEEIISPLIEFKQIPVFPHGIEFFSCCFKGYGQNINTDNLKIVDYGYALNAESIEKYLLDNYADDENEYLVDAGLMSMDYEKYYKQGSFIDLNGNDTDKDFYALDGCEKLKENAQFKNEWIYFCIYDINKGIDGHIIEKNENQTNGWMDE